MSHNLPSRSVCRQGAVPDVHQPPWHSPPGPGEEGVHPAGGAAEEHGGAGCRLQPADDLLGRPGSQGHLQVLDCSPQSDIWEGKWFLEIHCIQLEVIFDLSASAAVCRFEHFLDGSYFWEDIFCNKQLLNIPPLQDRTGQERWRRRSRKSHRKRPDPCWHFCGLDLQEPVLVGPQHQNHIGLQLERNQAEGSVQSRSQRTGVHRRGSAVGVRGKNFARQFVFFL